MLGSSVYTQNLFWFLIPRTLWVLHMRIHDWQVILCSAETALRIRSRDFTSPSTKECCCWSSELRSDSCFQPFLRSIRFYGNTFFRWTEYIVIPRFNSGTCFYSHYGRIDDWGWLIPCKQTTNDFCCKFLVSQLQLDFQGFFLVVLVFVNSVDPASHHYRGVEQQLKFILK